MDFWLLKKGQWNLIIPRIVLETASATEYALIWPGCTWKKSPHLHEAVKACASIMENYGWDWFGAPHVCSAWRLTNGHEATTVNTNMSAWINSFGHLTSREAKFTINISEASTKAHVSLHSSSWACCSLCCELYKAVYWCSIGLS